MYETDEMQGGGGVWYFTPLSTIFQLYRGVLWVEETGENHRSDH